MDEIRIEGIKLTKLKQIFHPQGNIFHGMKKSDPGFAGFGEAYFSTIKYLEIKPWKKHLRMTLNLLVPVGKVRFVIFDQRQNSLSCGIFEELILSTENYYRLTIPPDIWMAFQGIGKDLNLVLNLADIEHDPDEIMRLELPKIEYDWRVQES